MLYYTRIIFIVFFALFLKTSDAQNPFYKTFGVTNGFPCSTVYDVYQSKNGFIWFATDVGLFSYDGFDVKNQNNTYPFDKAVTNILEDSSGKIWCQSFKGIFYYTQGDSLVIEPSISQKNKFHAAQMLNGKILASITKQGVNLFNTSTKKNSSVTIPEFNVVIPSYNDNDTLILRGYFGDKTFFISPNGKYKKTFPKNASRRYYTVRFNNQLISLTKEFPFNIIFEDGTVKALSFKQNSSFYINNIKTISKNRLAICTSNGLYLLDKDYNIINSSGYYTDINVSNITEDLEGNFWLSSLNKGLVFTNQFNIILNNPEYVFLTVCHSKNALYFGTLENTVIKMDSKTKVLDTLYHYPIKQNISNILFNPHKNELVFTNSKFNVMNTLNNSVTSINLKVNDIDTLDRSHYILATDKGLLIYPNDKSELITNWKNKHSTINENALSISAEPKEHYQVIAINNKIYTSTSDGLFEYSTKGVRLINYNNTSLNINNLGVINNELIVITYNAGVLKYSKGQLTPLFNEINGMSKSDLYLGKTFENKLYLLHYDCMQRYDPVTKENYSINMTDGVESDLGDFTVINDTIHATNYEGFLSFKLDSTLATKTKPKLILNAFYINDNATDLTKNQAFSHTQNNIKINYSLIDYRGRKYTKVYYKLNNGSWVETNPKFKELLFTALEPNTYTLQLKAINYRGYESNYITLKFTIKPPFYKTWWFIGLIVLSISGAVAFFAYYRIKQLQKKQKEILEKARLLHELDLSNIKSLRAQMNPHFLYNALNAIQSFIYTGNKETAVTSLGIFSDLSRGVLDSSRSSEISLFDELALIENYLKLETMRLPKINYQLNIDPELNLHDTYIPTMIIQPLVENAVYHGLSNKQGVGLLSINFTLLENVLEVVVQDDGIGRDAAAKLRQRALKKSASFSTSANLSRIELLNANKQNKIIQTITDLYSSDKNATGTKVELIIPINDYD